MSCRASLLRRLTDHLLGCNQVEGLDTDAAKAAFFHEMYNRAYTVHVLVSAMPRWQWSICGTVVTAGSPQAVEALQQWLQSAHDTERSRSKRPSKKGKRRSSEQQP